MLDLPPSQPQFPMQGSISPSSVVQFNLNCVQVMALASDLVNALKQNHQDATEVPPPYDYQGEFMHILAEGLGIKQAIIAEGLGIHHGRGQCQGQNQVSWMHSFIWFSELESLSLDMIRWLVT
jgi:hypothetical protein